MTHKCVQTAYHTAITVYAMATYIAPQQKSLYLITNACAFTPNLATKVQKERQMINT